jgi:hypothetical protein
VVAAWSEPRPGRTISPERLDHLLTNAREMEQRDPWTAESVRYAGRAFVQANLPHSIRQIDPFATFLRSNGKFTLQIKPDARYGMPYGSIPRLLLLWVADEVRRTKSPELFLGDNLSKFMGDLDMVPTGGRWGTVTRLRDQMLRLFNADIRFTSSDDEGAKGSLLAIERYELWWNRPTDARQSDLWRSQIHLTTPLFEELLVHSHPVDMRIIKALRRSPMELDVYCWLTSRMFSLERPLFLTYEILRSQFGSQYADAFDFKVNLDKALWSVLRQYRSAKVEARVRNERNQEGWRLHPSPTSVPTDPRPALDRIPRRPRKLKN